MPRMFAVEAPVSAAESTWNLLVLIAVATAAGFPKSFNFLDLELVEEGAEVYART